MTRLIAIQGIVLALNIVVFFAPNVVVAQSTIEGKIISNQIGTVSGVLTGERSVRVEELAVRFGDRVKMGDLIARLSTAQLESDRNVALAILEEAKASVGVAESNLAGAKLIFDRQSGLKNSSSFRRAAFEDAEIALNRAESSLKSIQATSNRRQAEVDRLNLEIELATIKAPFDGVVTKVLKNVGATVTQENPLIVEMLNTSLAEIELEVPTSKLPQFEIGKELSYSVEDSPKFPARVRAIVPVQNQPKQTRVVRLELSADKGPSDFIDQQTVQVFLSN